MHSLRIAEVAALDLEEGDLSAGQARVLGKGRKVRRRGRVPAEPDWTPLRESWSCQYDPHHGLCSNRGQGHEEADMAP
jgi:site-specific recombinase XerC